MAALPFFGYGFRDNLANSTEVSIIPTLTEFWCFLICTQRSTSTQLFVDQAAGGEAGEGSRRTLGVGRSARGTSLYFRLMKSSYSNVVSFFVHLTINFSYIV